MERTFTASTKAAFALLAFIFALGVFRAATRDVTPGEAWNYDRYVSASWTDTFSHFDTNNHVWNTLLVRISTSALGRKEIALRLPSLFAGLLYFWAVWRLARRLYQGWLFTLAVALLVLNPLVVDALSEARGYGMAIAAWSWALEFILLYLEQHRVRNLNLAAMSLAFSVAACVTFIVPALALALAATLFLRRTALRELWLPMLVFLFVLLAIPLNRALLTDFAQGATSLRQTLAELTHLTLGLESPPLDAGIRILLALTLVVSIVKLTRPDKLLHLVTVSALSGLLLLLIAHAWIKTPFPERGAIYFIPILTLLGLGLSRRATLYLGTACLMLYALNVPLGSYLDGQEFAGSREIAKALRTDAGQRLVRVSTSPAVEPIFNYYRARYRQGNWSRIENKPQQPGADYYILAAGDAHLIDQWHLHVMAREPNLILAAK